MFTIIGFDYQAGVDTNTGYRVIKRGPGKYDVILDAKLRGTPEAQQTLQRATDEINAGVHNGN